jgi:Concanavalin A-like lectin/glucanases superfamily
MSNRDDDLVLHLNLDHIDISTSTTPDSSKSGLKAKVHGASLVADDIFGACLSFQGQDDHVQVSSVNLTDTNPPHTIEGWIKMETYPQARAWILLLGQEGVDSHHWLLGDALGKKAQLGAWGKAANQATSKMPVGEWVHVATTHDGSNLVCYLNGQPVDKKTATFNLTDKRLTLAKRVGATEKNFQGKMAHVRIYRRALSMAEIREDMDTDRDDLVLHLNLDDIDISTNMTPDSSKSGLKAKVSGASLVEDDTFGACLNFKSQDDHVEVSSLGLPGENPPHTIEAWIKMQAYPEKAKSFILLLGQADYHAHHWLLNSETAGDLGKKAQLGHWGDDSSTHARPVIPLAEWVHLATTFDGLNYVCYLNGQPIEKHEHYKFTLTDKRLTLAGHAKLRDAAQSRSIATENNFQGRMAHIRIYRRALSEGQIKKDMDADRLALPVYRRGHPITFSLRDQDENYVLYIGDDPRDHHRLNLELRNTSAQIRFKKEEKAADKASEDNHHFELVFRNGVLSDKTLKKLRENKEDVIVSKEAKEQWDLFCPPREASQTGTISVYFLYKDTSKLFGPNTSLVIPLRNISANAGSGARGTRVELKLNQLTYVDETTPITGSRIQHLQIINHLGSRHVPLHVGFVGSNRILNDGSSANQLVLQLMNVLTSEGDTSVRLTTDSKDREKSSKFLISFDVQSAKEVAPWSLCTEEEIVALKDIIVTEIHVVDSEGNPVKDAGWLEVKRTDPAALGESPVWSIAPRKDIVLRRDDYIQIQISNIETSLPSGVTNLYLDYQNIPGFWDGQVVCPIEKAPLLFYDVKDEQGKYTGELRVGIGCVKPEAKLEIALGANDVDTKPLVIRKDKVNYLTVLKDGKVGIGKGKEEPKASLDVNGEIRANFFRAGEGINSKQLHVGSGSSSISADRVNAVIASQTADAGIAIAQRDGVNVLFQASGAGGYIGTASNHALVLRTGDQDRVVVDADGNASIMGGLHVGGDSDPGDTNLLVDGSLAVNGNSNLKGSLTVKSTIRLQHGDKDDFPAAIAVEPDALEPGHSSLLFKTWQKGGWVNKMVIYPNGQVCIGVDRFTPQSKPPDAALTVGGSISEQLPIIDVGGNKDWDRHNHPIMKYFASKLKGKPVGTMLRAITNQPGWEHLYWRAWVDANGNIPVAHNYPIEHRFAWKQGVVYAD